ncbi:CDP-diacylglycerol--serine O-phosphatidyltransferase [bacterium]|nr:CDP-diacylglycerol--serine O-phosphatidyltransferase [bacterium]
MDGSPMQKWRYKFSIRRGVYLLPSLFTLANMLCGFYAIVLAYRDRYLDACIALVIAGLADGLDGRIARLTNTTSEFGVEFDSLADLLSFCMAPAFLLYFRWLEDLPKIGWVCAFVFVACGAIRLARFNAYDSTSDTAYFNGLPTPAAAAGAISLVLLEESIFPGATHAGVVAPWSCLVLAFLMVSNIRYPSFKGLKWGGRVPARLLIAIVFLIFIFISKPDVAISSFCFVYVLSGPVIQLLIMAGIRKPRPVASGEEAHS